jgi:hypothetical protein
MSPEEFRKNIIYLISDEMDELGFSEIGDCVQGEWAQRTKGSLTKEEVAIDKAMTEAYNSLQVSLRKLSRLATRLDYLEKESK